MSHVDEGALHAYLDGALDEYPSGEAEKIRSHLDACAECAGRLEVERRIRAEAHGLLGLAAPDVDVPSFEELRAYVQRTRRRREGLGRLQRLGWAASIVVAIGAGWMLREGQLQTRALDPARQGGPPPAAESVDAPTTAAGAEAPPLETGAPADLAVEADEAGRSADPAASPAETGAGAASSPVQSEPEPAARMRTEVVYETIEAVDETIDTVDETTAPLVVPTGSIGIAADAVDVLAEAGGIEQETAGARTDDAAAPAAGAAWRGQVAERMVPSVPTPDSAADVVVTAGPMRSAETSTSDLRALRPVMSAIDVSRSETFGQAPEALSPDSVPADPVAVPGHEVLSLVNLGDGTTPWGVRVTQRMDDGRVFEVFHLEEGVDPSILPDEGDGAGEVRAETAAGWVVIRGPLSERELAELLGSLFPGDS